MLSRSHILGMTWGSVNEDWAILSGCFFPCWSYIERDFFLAIIHRKSSIQSQHETIETVFSIILVFSKQLGGYYHYGERCGPDILIRAGISGCSALQRDAGLGNIRLHGTRLYSSAGEALMKPKPFLPSDLDEKVGG